MEKDKWILKQQDLLLGDSSNDIKPKRAYLHFDYRIRTIQKHVLVYIFDKSAIKAHSFYPFIRYTTKVRRRKKVDGKIGFESKEREISYASHLDSLIYSWYANQLNDEYEDHLQKLNISDSIIAYRLGIGSTIDHACRAFRSIQNLGESHVICLDIKGFFDNLDHKLIKKSWAYLISNDESLPNDHYAVYKAITKYSYVNHADAYQALGIDVKNPYSMVNGRLCTAKEFREKIDAKGFINKNSTCKGIPQGSTMSALLANIYMLGFDTRIRKQIDQWHGIYYRYSDDILISVPKSVPVTDIENFVNKEITKVNLSISAHKTESFTFYNESGVIICRNAKTKNKKSLGYLGLSYDGRRILLKHASLVSYQRRAVNSIRREYRHSFRRNTKLARRKIYERFTRMGKRNYQTYIQRCIKGLHDHGFDPIHLKRQASDYFVHNMIKKLHNVVHDQLARRSARRKRDAT